MVPNQFLSIISALPEFVNQKIFQPMQAEKQSAFSRKVQKASALERQRAAISFG